MLFLLLVLPVVTAIPCDSGWYEFEGACYVKYQDRNYIDAEATCVENGAHLTSVTSLAHANFFKDSMNIRMAYTGLQWRDDLSGFAHPLLNSVVNLPLCITRNDREKCALLQTTGSDPCILPINCATITVFVCQKGGWTTSTTTTTTTTKRPTTTTKPKPPLISDPKKWIIDYSKGTQIHRSYHSGQFIHHYTIDWRNTPSGFNREVGNGFVVSEDRFPQIKATCPNLLKVGMWRYGAMTYIGNNPPGSFVKQESFYCAPSQFYCGANFLLRRLDKHGGGNIFYASNENEANQQLLGNDPGLYSANWFKETPCWIWQDYTDTWYSIVKANGGMIWSGYHAQGIVHFYTLQRHLVPAGFQKERAAPPGYVVMQNLYDSYFKTRCPELIPMKIWHGQNGAGQIITWIGREGRSPPATLRNGWVEELRFYCAPRFNYCNANFLLRRMDKTNGAVTFYYPWSEQNAASQLKGEAPGVFKNSKWSEEVCYIWANWL